MGNDPRENKVRYKLYHNIDARFSRPGTPEDRYFDGHEGEVEVDDLTPHPDVCETIRHRHPSLSMGDVIVLTRYEWNGDDGPMILVYTVDVVGFKILGQRPTQVLEGYFESRRS